MPYNQLECWKTDLFNNAYIKAALDENHYDQGIKVSDDELATLAIERDGFHGEWNYRLRPKNQ